MKLGATLASLSALGLAACSVSDGNENAGEADTEQADLTPEGPSMLSKLVGGGKPMAIDVQQPHPNGVVLQLTSLQAKSSETVVKAIISNGDNSEQALNRYGDNKRSYIVAADGTKLYLSPPVNNTKLEIPAGQRMEAELVFLGRLPKGAATLILNDGGQTDSEHTTTPGFRIPLPIDDAAFSDDGSKKN